jgi:hypothetical protein
MKTGNFTDAQVIDFLPEVRRYYESQCRRLGITPEPYPELLKKREESLIEKRRRANQHKENAARP